MASRYVFQPFAAQFPTTSFPQPTTIHATSPRPVLAFDQTTSETAYWTAVAPQGLTAPYVVVISYCASVASGTIAWTVAIEAVSDGDATDLDATTSFDTGNTSGAVTVPGTAGYPDQITIALTTNDSLAAGDYFRLSLLRDTAADSAAGDVYCLSVEFRDAA